MLLLHAARSFGAARTRAQSVARAAVLPRAPRAGTCRAARHAREGSLRRVVTAAAHSARLSEATNTRSGIGGMMWMTASRGVGTSARTSRPNAAALNPRQLTAELGKARDLPELLSLHRRHGGDFDGFNIGAFWSRFKALPRGERGKHRHSLAPVCEQTVRMLPELNARQVANVVHAFAKAKLVGAGPWESVWAALPEAVRRRLGGSIRRTSPTRRGRSQARATRRRSSSRPSQLRWCAGGWEISIRRSSPTRRGRSQARATRRRSSSVPSQLRWCAGGWAISVRRLSPTRRGLLLSLTLHLRMRCSARRALRRGVPTLKSPFQLHVSYSCISGRCGVKSVGHCGQGSPTRCARPALTPSSLKERRLRNCNPMW